MATRACQVRSHRRDQIEISCGLVGFVVFMFHNYRMGVFMLQASVYACHVEFRGICYFIDTQCCSLMNKRKPDVVRGCMYFVRLKFILQV